MKVQDAVKSIIKVSGNTQKSVSDKLGLSGQGAISMFLKSKSMRVENLLNILNACGYELVARSADGTLPEYTIGDKLGSVQSVQDSGANMSGIEEMVRRMVADELRKSACVPDLPPDLPETSDKG